MQTLSERQLVTNFISEGQSYILEAALEVAYPIVCDRTARVQKEGESER